MYHIFIASLPVGFVYKNVWIHHEFCVLFSLSSPVMKVSIVIQRLFHGSHLILSLYSANFISHLVPPGTDIFGGGKKSQHQSNYMEVT